MNHKKQNDMIKKNIYYMGESRITEIHIFGILVYRENHEYYLSETAASRAR